MHRELIHIGNITLYSYGTMVALGFFLATAWAYSRAKNEGISSESVLSQVIWVIVSGIIGARLFYVIQFWPQFQDAPLQVLNIRGGGLVFYGGLISGLGAIILFSRINKLSVLKVFDLAAPATVLGYGIGRVGCFLNGCCYGKPTTMPWGVRFDHLLEARHPTQLYASVTALVIFGFLVYLSSRKKYDGQIIFWGVVLHSTYRFLIEFIRENPIYYGLSSAQWIALGLIAVAVGFRTGLGQALSKKFIRS
ncbi:MAG: prolipoprotein diacylglyceryl transferase [Candidatus Margulisiibacteriota bacterium]